MLSRGCEYDTISISDTYNDFFAEDDIELIKEYIKTIFGGFLMKKRCCVNDVLTLSISEKYIYTALTQIVENREIVYRFGRKGYIIKEMNFIYFNHMNIKMKICPFCIDIYIIITK